MATEANSGLAALRLAFARGDAAGVVREMRAHAAQPDVQLAGCTGYYELVDKNADKMLEAAAAGGVEAVVAVLRAHLSDAAVLFQATVLLSRLMYDSTARASAAAAAGAFEAMAAAMRAHPRDAKLQALGCEALLNLVFKHEQNRRLFGATAIHAILAAVRGHVADACMQERGCAALAECIEGNHVLAVDAGALEAVLAAMRAHPAQLALQVRGCKAMYNILTPGGAAEGWVRAAAGRAVTAGLLNALTSVCTQHVDAEEVVMAACQVLKHLTKEDIAAAVRAAECVKSIVAALRAHAAQPPLQQQLCIALHALTADHAGHVRTAVDAGALELLVTILRISSSAEARFLFPASGVLFSMVRVDTGARARAGALGAVAVLVAVLRAHPRDARLHETAIASLVLLLNDAMSVAAAHRAGAVPILKAAQRTHAGDGRVPTLCTATLAALQNAEANADAAMAALLAEEEAERAAKAAPPASKRKNKKKNKGGGGGGDNAARSTAGAASGSAAPYDPELRAPSPAVHEEQDEEAAQDDADAGAAPAPGAQHAAEAAEDDDDTGGGALDDKGDAGPSGSGAGCSAAAPPPAAPPPRGGAPRAYCPPMGPEGVPAAFPVPALPPPPPPWLPPFQQPCAAQQPAAAALPPLPAYLAGLVLNPPRQPQPAPLPAPAAPLPAPPAVAAEPPLPPPVMKECCVCFLDVEVNSLHLLMPCAHRCVCGDCAAALMALPPPAPRLCPKCRKHVTGASVVFDE
jgi:hypothetical protein